ncbi:MAG: hypothetical protein ABTQ73_08490 [Caldilineales bacterium]
MARIVEANSSIGARIVVRAACWSQSELDWLKKATCLKMYQQRQDSSAAASSAVGQLLSNKKPASRMEDAGFCWKLTEMQKLVRRIAPPR